MRECFKRSLGYISDRAEALMTIGILLVCVSFAISILRTPEQLRGGVLLRLKEYKAGISDLDRRVELLDGKIMFFEKVLNESKEIRELIKKWKNLQ